ncbi:CpsB/CapC family capsule biosynthesis tyrosine phosphatase [Dyadobacter sp. 676]|uniref:protein-tyrosine-phosphatase n=1 Tax=Dyadobacter sp. 676 TaxID=3088362 RepID=A0AAU8FLX1_9BACT
MLNWLFEKKKKEDADLSVIGMDLHSHLIPGIDDGVETIEDSLAMLQKMYRLGYRKVYTTPHVMWDCYRNTPAIIREGIADVRVAAANAGLDMDIHAAAEYFIDEHFVELLNTGGELLTLPGNRLLVELPYSTKLMNTSETLFQIVAKGYRPVLAHPERYTYFYQDPSIFRKLCDQGCELQVNVLSLGNYYGENVHKMADWLLSNGLITFVGTDAHKPAHLDLINRTDKKGWLKKYKFQNLKLMDE